MTRDELILIGVNAEREAEGLPPLAADHPWTGHHSMVRAALTAIEAAGVALMPVEAAKEMLLAGNDGIDDDIDFWNYDSGRGYSVEPQAAFNVWKRMLAASPYRSAP
ncbi:MAG: hypothetical protein ACK5PJ_07860 [Ralstonia sp.]